MPWVPLLMKKKTPEDQVVLTATSLGKLVTKTSITGERKLS
jgi:hypothetical protein